MTSQPLPPPPIVIVGYQCIVVRTDPAGNVVGERPEGRIYTVRGAAECLAEMMRKTGVDAYVRAISKVEGGRLKK